MHSKIARTGKVKVPKWGVVNIDGEIIHVYPKRSDARNGALLLNSVFGTMLKVVCLSGTVSYTVTK